MRGGIYFDEKLERRRKRMFKIKVYAGLAAFFVLVIGVGYLVVYSPLFRIKQINVEMSGVSNIDENLRTSEIKELIENLKNFFANQSKITEFLGPENILIWKPEKSAEFLKNYPQIEELKIEKHYLGREIKISVSERERFGIWCQLTTNNQQPTTNNCYWFDKKGVIFSEALRVEGQLINKVDDFSGRSLSLGEPALEEKFLSNLIKIFEILEKSGLKIKSLKLENLELQEIVTDSSLMPKIHFSLRIDPEFTLAVLESIKKIGFGKTEYIDLRVENRAYYKLK